MHAEILFYLKSQQNPPDENELATKYWNYRDRFKKQFVIIGNAQGEGINIANIDNQPANSNVPGASNLHTQTWANTNGLNGQPGVANLHGYREWGDAMAQQGDYITVLATEYKLLKDAGKDVNPTLNELYYAIEAVDRMDFFAEKYFNVNLNTSANYNGFIIRDDVPGNFGSKWTLQYANTEDPQDAYEGILSNYYDSVGLGVNQCIISKSNRTYNVFVIAIFNIPPRNGG